MAKVIESARRLHPQEPWLWREDWALGRVRSADAPTVVIVWVLAISFAAFSVPLLYVAADQIGESVGKAAVALIFPLASVGLWWWAVTATVRWRRFRNVFLELTTRPGVLGGELAGVVHLGNVVRPEGPYRVVLSCIRVRRRNNNDTDRRILWQGELSVPVSRSGRGFDGTTVPFSFEIPYELPASMVEMVSRQQIVWWLQIHADLPGADLSSTFEVPVYETAESSDRVTERLSAETPPDPEEMGAPLALARDTRVRVRRLADGVLELYFPAGRNKAGAAFLTFFAALWSGLIFFVAGEIPGLVKLFMVPFALVGILLWLFVPVVWLQRTTVRARRGTLEIRTRTFGRGRPKVLAADAIEAIAAEVKGSANGKARWAIEVHPRAGRAVRAGGDLCSKEDAQRLAAALWQEIRGAGGIEPATYG